MGKREAFPAAWPAPLLEAALELLLAVGSQGEADRTVASLKAPRNSDLRASGAEGRGAEGQYSTLLIKGCGVRVQSDVNPEAR